MRLDAKKMPSDGAGMEISGTGDIPASEPSKHRAVALDILRGLAILMMVFSGCVPFDKPLPNWLFHAQEPTSYDQNHLIVHVFDPTHAGITFVDLVFPIFLFSLGAAIPLALAIKLDRGASRFEVIKGGFLRLIQLSWFAVYIGNIRPAILHDQPILSTWLIALVGYALLYPMFTRLPENWSSAIQFAVRIVGYGGGVLLLAILDHLHYYPKQLGFQLARVDVIIVALGDMAFFGTLIWVLTRDNLLARLAVISFLLAIRLGASEPGWLMNVWTFAPKNTGFFFAFDYLKYLFLVVPGTIAGDQIHQWINRGQQTIDNSSQSRLAAFVALTVFLVVGILIGYEARVLLPTALFSLAVCLTSLWLLKNPQDATQELLANLVKWGCYWLLLGVLLQPFEGGIKKDPSTLSYYFVTAGLAYFLLTALLILTTCFKIERPFSLLAYSGQNPMIAYVSMANLILPTFALIDLQPLLNRAFHSPWMGVLLGALETLLLAILVSLLSQRKIFWRT